MGVLVPNAVIDAVALRPGQIHDDLEVPRGLLWNNPQTAGDHTPTLFGWEWAKHEPSLTLLPQEITNCRGQL